MSLNRCDAGYVEHCKQFKPFGGLGVLSSLTHCACANESMTYHYVGDNTIANMYCDFDAVRGPFVAWANTTEVFSDSRTSYRCVVQADRHFVAAYTGCDGLGQLKLRLGYCTLKW